MLAVQKVRGEGLSALSPSVNIHAITRAAVIYITHKSHEPIKYGFGGTKICSGGRQNNFNAGKTLWKQHWLWFFMFNTVKLLNLRLYIA